MQTKDGFVIGYDDKNRTVTITKSVKNGQSFADEVDQAKSLLVYFRAQNGGKVWGCEGAGFNLQRRVGVVRVNKSGVTLAKFQIGMASIRERNSRWTR